MPLIDLMVGILMIMMAVGIACLMGIAIYYYSRVVYNEILGDNFNETHEKD